MGKPEWAERILALRKRLELSGAALGEKLGVSQMAISRWESGKHPPPAEAWISLGAMAAEKDDIEDLFYFWDLAGASRDVLERVLEKAALKKVAIGGGHGTALASTPRHIRKSGVKLEVAEQLHAALDLILERAPSTMVEDVAAYLTQRAGKYGGPR